MKAMSRFPNGFNGPISANGVPLLLTGRRFWHVGNVTGGGARPMSNGNSGADDAPFATTTYALSRAAAGDVVIVNEGHTETITGAAGVSQSTAGISVIGRGVGNNRPRYTFGTSTAATWLVSGANSSIVNIVAICNIDGLVKAFDVTGSNPYIDVECQDTSAAVEAARYVLGTGVDGGSIRMRVRGFIAGIAMVNAIRLVGCSDMSIEFPETDGAPGAYGVASTAWVEFHTTACHNIYVNGSLYNSGTTDGTKNVVDTVGGSTWSASLWDATAAKHQSGGSGSPLAFDDVSTVVSNQAVPSADSTNNVLNRDVDGNKTDAAVQEKSATGSQTAYLKGILDVLLGTDGLTTFPAGSAAANAVSLAEVIRYIQDQVINGTGTTLEADTSLFGVLAGASGIPTFPAAAAAANSVSIAEVLRYIQDRVTASMLNRNSTNYFSVVADFTSATWNTVAAHEIATTMGAVHLIILPEVTAPITSGGGTATLVLGDETTTDSIIASTDSEALTTGEWWFDTTATRTVANKSVFEKTDLVVANGKDIGYTIGTEALTGGSITFHCWWEPIDGTGSVVAGAGGPL